MLLANNPIVGMICLESPNSIPSSPRPSDDSTLESLLASLVASDSLTIDGRDSVCILTNTRISRYWVEPATSAINVNADLAQLLEELETDYAQLTQGLAK